jgi:hypothetical protein
VLLQKARQGQYDYLDSTEQQRLKKIIGDYSKDQEAFALLLVGYCHSNTMLKRVFGKIDDYTELLLPDNMLQDSGFLHLLNTTDAISDDEYEEVELIGWLYQFYISEKKDDVFASFKKGKKAEAKDIPAATQIFTPNWIVKYMVENTAGKIWLDKHPDSPLKDEMKYLVDTSTSLSAGNDSDVSSSCHPEPVEGAVENVSLINNIEDLTLIDPASGSGHILVEGFDLLYQMYMEEYYAPEEAVEAILKNNLYGLDIDDRAAQLATFAILLKAATKYRDVFTKGWLPNVYAMPEAADFSNQEIKDFLGEEGAEYVDELEAALRLMKQAKNLGSVMKLNISEAARAFVEQQFTAIKNSEFRDFNIEGIYQKLANYIPVLLLLTKKYTSVVANPPYMTQTNMNPKLKGYLIGSYPLSKPDLYSAFIESMLSMLKENARVGCITMDSWMFKVSYTNLRKHLISNFSITSLSHFGWHVIGIAFGTVVSIIENKTSNYLGEYSYLDFSEIDEKEHRPLNFPLKNNGKYNKIKQKKFLTIPDYQILYWITEKALNVFSNCEPLNQYAQPKKGITTSSDPLFVRDWYEVNNFNINFSAKNSLSNEGRWFPVAKGGPFRKWYGNLLNVLDWEENGKRLKSYRDNNNRIRSACRNLQYNFLPGITWNDVSSVGFACRKTQEGVLMLAVGPRIYNLYDETVTLSLLNSKVGTEFFDYISPGNKFEVGKVSSFPIIKNFFNLDLENSKLIGVRNVEISKKDWDSRETSWDFEKTPLLNNTNSLEVAYTVWQEEVTKYFFQLHNNEEELNRIFIAIYGLQDELTPDVALKDITILQEELGKKDLEKLESDFRANGNEAITLPINKAEVISQFISYAIGLFMGRYRLDKKGLNIAHPNPTKEELEKYNYNNGNIIIDEDAILPLMGANCSFSDDVLQQIYSLLDAIWGADTRTENINFIQECLNKDIEKFLVKDFFKYHCSMYKKKPIYWLFASPKGAFQVLVYMHRMNAFTVEKIRANYLLEHIKNLGSEKSVLLSNESNLSTEEAKRLDQLRKDIPECETYDLELKDVADNQIAFDLDDGVTVNYEKFKTVVAKIK